LTLLSLIEEMMVNSLVLSLIKIIVHIAQSLSRLRLQSLSRNRSNNRDKLIDKIMELGLIVRTDNQGGKLAGLRYRQRKKR
jgi:uncharacterized protein YfeS